MRLLKSIYYQYFLFYRRIFKDPDPHFATIAVLTLNEALFVNAILNFVALGKFCYQIPVLPQFTLSLIIFALNYLYFLNSGRGKAITREKPKLFNSYFISGSITLLLFLITTSWLFWWPIYGKEILDTCGK